MTSKAFPKEEATSSSSSSMPIKKKPPNFESRRTVREPCKLKLQDHTRMGLNDTKQLTLFNKLENLRIKPLIDTAVPCFKEKTKTYSKKEGWIEGEEISSIIKSFLTAGKTIDLVSDLDPTDILYTKVKPTQKYKTDKIEEIFFPKKLQIEGQEAKIYIYPWLSSGTPEEMDLKEGPKRFVTAACFLGSQVQGMDNNSDNPTSRNMIKHAIGLKPGQKIVAVSLRPAIQIYELSLNFLQKTFYEMLREYGATEKHLHLPVYDYILFGIQLYIRNQVDRCPLNEFFKIVLTRGMEITNHFKEISKKYGFSITISSPFESLFSTIQERLLVELRKDEGDFFTIILGELGLIDVLEHSAGTPKPIPTSEGTLTPEALKAIEEAEAKFVQNCLFKLTHESTNPIHKQVWIDVMNKKVIERGKEQKLVHADTAVSSEYRQTPYSQTITDIDKLFNVGNGAFILMSSHGMPNYSVFVVEALSEHPIALMARTLHNCPELKGRYPITVNLTVMEPIQTHHKSLRGYPFYQFLLPEEHTKLFHFWDRNKEKLMHSASLPEKEIQSLLGYHPSPAP